MATPPPFLICRCLKTPVKPGMIVLFIVKCVSWRQIMFGFVSDLAKKLINWSRCGSKPQEFQVRRFNSYISI